MMAQLIALAEQWLPWLFGLVTLWLLWRIKSLLAAIFATLQFVVEMYVDSFASPLEPGKTRNAAVDRLKQRHDDLTGELSKKTRSAMGG